MSRWKTRRYPKQGKITKSSIEKPDKMKHDAIAWVSYQLLAISTRLRDLGRKQLI